MWGFLIIFDILVLDFNKKLFFEVILGQTNNRMMIVTAYFYFAIFFKWEVELKCDHIKRGWLH